MILERLLTAYLKRKNAKVLTFDIFDAISPPEPQTGKEYLLYVHIPFCEELCPYCSFNRFPLDVELARAYFRALGEEIRIYKTMGYQFSAVYVGGGTPTVLPSQMARLLDDLRKWFNVKEVSVETNPNHLTEGIVRILKDGGVNRLSVGVQSFDDALLKMMERYHKYGSGTEIRDRLASLMGTFNTLNVDMIFNFPTQTMEVLERDVQTIHEIQADQVTFYPLMVSDITRHELARRFGPISYGREKAFYERIVEMLGDTYGFGTAWCFSRKSRMIDEYIVDYDQYVGAGSGSFGYVDGTCFANTFSIPDYLQALEKGRLPLLAKREFSRKEQAQYYFMMKLFGMSMDLAETETRFGGDFARTMWKEISSLRAASALVSEDGVIKLTRKGRYLWVIMMREFFTGVNNFRDLCRAKTNVPGRQVCRSTPQMA